MNALIIQHDDDAPPGLLLDVLRAEGVGCQLVRLDQGEPLPDPSAVKLAASLGSAASAYETSPDWIAGEREWLRAADQAGTAILGICFGAQMLAAALGGGVRPALRPERDWITVSTHEPQLIPAGPWLSWHDDIVELPPDAELIAESDGCPQAFRLRAHLGVQFHPEVTPQIVEGWVSGSRDGELDGRTMLERTAREARRAAADARALFQGFIRSVD